MATRNITQCDAGSDAKAQDYRPLPTTATMDDMENAIREIDSQVQVQMREIVAVANMAMRWLKSPIESVTHYETVYQALALIKDKSLSTAENVQHEASEVECATYPPEMLLTALPRINKHA